MGVGKYSELSMMDSSKPGFGGELDEWLELVIPSQG